MKKTSIKQIFQTGMKNPADLDRVKRKFAKKLRKTGCLSNVELLKVYRRLTQKGRLKTNTRLENLLKKKRGRSLSGIVTVSVLTKPYPCPGQCLYCPTQRKIPKSYLSNEPAVMRAIANNFDPYQQVQSRLKSLQLTGHPLDKIELIVIGGTWSYLPRQYQTWFIRECLRASNEFMQRAKNREQRTENKKQKGENKKFKSNELTYYQQKNERAKCRIIGITVETRPDFINEKEVINLRRLGVTRVELGVQSLENDVLAINRRGHRIEATITATKLLKDAGFKVCYHIMPNLLGSNIKRDKQMFANLFSDSRFQPDLLKIYPCVVLKQAKEFYQLWKAGKYQPYQDKELIDLLVAIKKKIPVYCRIQRLIRDIPAQSITAGCRMSNLRQAIADQLKRQGKRCWCIRCREVKEEYRPNIKLSLFRQDYDASDGKEIFLSFEDQARKNLYSLLRLRIPSQVLMKTKHFISALQDSAIIRELHTYGQVVPLSKKEKLVSPQHQGLGIRLIKEAEKIAKKEFALKKMAVISGIGARDYYSRKAGYQLEDTYMTKMIK